MDAFIVHTGTAVPLRRNDVDTDQIIPSDWLKRVARTGFGAGLFSEWRESGDFILDAPERAGASVLLAGANFGTGSSREHAVWALQDHGFRVVISTRFADIFRSNSFKGGLLTVVLPEQVVEHLMAASEADPTLEITVDLEAREVRALGRTVSFELDEHTRWRLLNGFDDIGLTLQHTDDVTAFEALRATFLPTTTAP